MAKIIIKKNVANQKLHYTCKQHDLTMQGGTRPEQFCFFCYRLNPRTRTRNSIFNDFFAFL